MHDTSFIPFTKEMKKDYTILVPNMLPYHFKMIVSVMRTYGYNVELLETSGPQIAETGLKYTHNDTCYPAILVIGQFIDALTSGKYDPHKTALIMFQTGGGCRASNYISLIRKALVKADMAYVPVISFNMLGLEKHPGFKLNFKILHAMMYGILYGDLIMSLVNQVRPYEINKGDAEALAEKLTEELSKEIGRSGKIKYRKIKENYDHIIDLFAKIPMQRRKAVKATKNGIPCSVLYSAPPPLKSVIAKTGRIPPRKRRKLEKLFVFFMLTMNKIMNIIPAANNTVKAGLQNTLSPQ